MKKFNTDIGYLVLMWFLVIGAILLTYAHHGILLIDCGREAYYPTQILSGKILYKDIFIIYGPFAYMFNALLFKIFGINLNVLYVSGCVCSFFIASLIYLISKKFLSNFLSFAIASFTILGVLNLNLFNFILPYSYAILYGVTAFLVSFLLLIKYFKQPEKTLYLYLSCFFAGLCITCKYEFLPYLIVILYSIFKIMPLKFKEYIYIIFSLLVMPFICFGILFLQGLRLNDLIYAFSSIQKMTETDTLKYFYMHQGVYYHKYTPLLWIGNFFKAVLPLLILIYSFKKENIIFKMLLFTVSILFMFICANPAIFSFLPFLILIFALFNFKTIIQNNLLTLLVLCGIIVSLKSFWGLATLNYGIFFIQFLLITFCALLLKLKENLLTQKVIGIYILITVIILGYQNLKELRLKNYLLHTERGQIYTNKNFGESSAQLIYYIQKNTKKSDEIVILPEGLMINFLTGRKTDNYYNSLIPLYVETFGEEDIINHFKKSKPEYIIFNNYNTESYYLQYFCKDYALPFCSFVSENYTKEKIIDKGFRYLIYKKK